MPFWQFFRKADMALFNLCTKIKNYGGQMYSFNASPGLLAIQIQIQAVCDLTQCMRHQYSSHQLTYRESEAIKSSV